MNLGAHIVRGPTGRYFAVGRVPESCIVLTDPPSRSAVMGGRILRRDGRVFGVETRYFETWQDAETAIRAAGIEPCTCCRDPATTAVAL